jgi:chromosome segregation ATPase
MLSRGLPIALKTPCQDRHEFEAGLLKMVAQVLEATRASAEGLVKGECPPKISEADAELKTRKAAVDAASEKLLAADAYSSQKQTALTDLQTKLASEEEEHKRLKGEDETREAEITEATQKRDEVTAMLEQTKIQGSSEPIAEYLKESGAENPLVAGVRSVLEKAPEQREGFDHVVIEHLQAFLTTRVGEWNATISEKIAAKANIHAETLGAWAVKECMGSQVKESQNRFDAAQEAREAARLQLTEAEAAFQEQEAVLASLTTDTSAIAQKAKQCQDALELLALLEAGKSTVEEAPAPMAVEEVNADVPMAVDEATTCAAEVAMEAPADVTMEPAIAA